VGPAFQDVSKKYSGQKDAEATLVKNIRAGGAGKWGPIPMPAQTALSEADIKALAAWVLAGAR
jgi:cytochrome c